MKTKILLSICLSLLGSAVLSQNNVSINNDASSADPSAILDIKSEEMGILIPRMTTSQRNMIVSPAEGLLVFDMETSSFWYFSSIWNEIKEGDDNQTLSINGQQLAISDGNSITIPSVDEQTLMLSGDMLEISNGNLVNLSGVDNQVLTLSGSDLSISNGNTVALPVQNSISDNDNDSRVEVMEFGDDDIVRIYSGSTSTPSFEFNGWRLEGNYGYDLFLGFEAGLSVTDGNTQFGRNTFVGYQAGKSVIPVIGGGGFFNTTLGHQTGQNLVDGSDNTFLGSDAGENLSSGDGNVMIGRASGSGVLDADYNVIIGDRAGFFAEGSGNIFLGHQAGYFETGDNKLIVQNDFNDTPLIYGEFDNDYVQIDGTLNIDGDYSFPNNDGTNGQVIGTDGNGQLSWVTPILGTNQNLSINGNNLTISDGNTVTLPSQNSLVDVDSDTRISVDDGTDNDEIRFFTGGATTPSFTIVDDRLESTSNQLKIGQDAGLNSNGSFNTYLGFQAGEENISGSYNTLIGHQAGRSLIGPSNTVIGTQAGLNITDGSSNIIIGDYAVSNGTTGSSNTYIGTGAATNANGSNNVFLGFNAGSNESGSNKLIIDNSGSSSPLIYGEFDNDLLRVNGDLQINEEYTLPSEDGTSGQVMTTDGNGVLSWSNSGQNSPFTENSNAIVPNAISYDFIIGSNSIEDSGTGVGDKRMFFDQSKAAFRAGGSFSTDWNSSNVGSYSFAANYNTIASGTYSTAFGSGSEATGYMSTAVGSFVLANSGYGIAMGRYNIGGAISTSSSNANDPALELGNGFSSGSRQNALTILKNGKVFLGNHSSYSNDIGTGYNVVMDGKLLCEEVRVQDSGNWPDYVFKKDYDLKSIEEVRDFIEINGHLPGIQSANEINGSGFETGEMIENLVEKVEELTLYIIQLQEEIQTIKEKN